MKLGGKRFEGNEEVEEHVRHWLTAGPQTFDEHHAVLELPNRWQKCVDSRLEVSCTTL